MKRLVIFGTAVLVLALPLAARGRPQAAGGPQRHRLALPAKDWALELEIPPPLTVLEGTAEPGRGRSFSAWYADKKSRAAWVVKVLLTPAQSAGGGVAFREADARRVGELMRLPKGDIKTSEYKQIPVAAYRLRGLEFVTGMIGHIPQRMSFAPGRLLSAYMAKDDVWIQLSVSGDSEKVVEANFRALIDTARFVDTSAPATSLDYFEKGHALYTANDVRAVPFYAKSLELERRERRLDQARWRTLVRGLADLYVATRDAARAQEVLEYGLSQDANDPWLNYYMARLHASRGDLDGAVASLERAFLNKRQGDLTTVLHDPLRDPHFERFHKDERFRKAVGRMRS